MKLFSKETKFDPSRFDSVIAQYNVFRGNVFYHGNLHVKGSIYGDVTPSRGDGTLGPDAVMGVIVEGTVHGKIISDYAIVSGRIFGDLEAKSIIVTKTGIIEGNIFYEEIKIEPGATINGKLNKVSSAKEETATV